MALSTGQVLRERYRVDAFLGGGGMGAVYRAEDLNLGIPVVVKENRLHTPEAQRQFERESSLLASLRHPNLPRVSDRFFLPGQGQYLVMDYIEGQDLNQLLERQGPVAPALAVGWMVRVLDAVGYLHSQGVIHRDIKPTNIKVTSQGQVFLVDFGLAKHHDPEAQTTIGARRITPGYAPLEQYGQGRTDARTDIYSAGATLYALLTGQAPPEATKLATGEARLTPPGALNPKVSPALEITVILAMQSRPIDRFQTAAHFRGALSEQALDHEIPEVETRLARTRLVPGRRQQDG